MLLLVPVPVPVQPPFACSHPLFFSTTQFVIKRRNHLHLHLLHDKFPSKVDYTCSQSQFQVTAIETHNHGLVILADKEEEEEMRCLPVDLCLTRELSPCLSIKEGYAKLKEAISQSQKQLPFTDTNTSGSGVIHYRVLVPPSAKALDWLCCQSQHTHLPIYPHFYFSSDQPNNFLRLSSFGHAICIHGSCGKHKGYRLLARYLSPDALTQAYGFTGLNLSKDISSQGEDQNSFYLFVPQIELRELDRCSVLAATLIWDDSFSLSFESAVYFLESSLDQMGHDISQTNFYERERWMSYNSAKENALQGDISHLVCLDGVFLAGIDNTRDKCMPKKELLTCDEYYVCISPNCAFTFNMFHYLNQSEFSIKECSNINMVWASLIVEELVRLGINYFCIAPGSRSSPLAINATRHPLTNCISCYDERSLAFHALGYARGSQKPAVIITSSGTAVSNLLPAVVEASQNFVPIILLTADRPPELLECGANQAIDQLNHFGKFVRQFWNLSPPTDEIFSRTVLTTVDSSVYLSTNNPMGPTHINCQFREPLHDSQLTWSTHCLTGLDHWLSNKIPYTKYINPQNLSICTNSDTLLEVIEIIKEASKGILVIGRLVSDVDIWAVILLARQLSWPVVADVLSGLRVRRSFSSYSDVFFMDCMDHALLSDTFKDWVKPDIVLQIGGSLTSKRMSQFLESCAPIPYILVDSHPYRHDPSHIVTYRIQSSVSQFAAIMCESQFSKKVKEWSYLLKGINSAIETEIRFQVQSESALTEPYVAHVISEVVATGARPALFVGNSMVLRDLDMYAKGSVTSTSDSIYTADYLQQGFHGIPVAGNRGASGIDGLLSTAIGFSIGSEKRVFCMVGDVSFLHDTNGLSLLNQRIRRKPITVVVVNNHGGAIFSLLPVAKKTQPDILNKFFYTSHDISLSDLCSAHKVKHVLVRTKQELQIALQRCLYESTDSIVEIASSIPENAEFHRVLRDSASDVINQAMECILWAQYDKEENYMPICSILKAEYTSFRMKLSTTPTSGETNEDESLLREGLILKVTLDDGTTGFGEIMPIEIHEESFSDAELQVRFLIQLMNGCKIDALLPLLNGSFSHWIWRNLGIPPSSIFPSVRCGLEMAILNALSAQRKSNLPDLLLGINNRLELGEDHSKNEKSIEICALVDCEGSPSEVAYVVSELVEEGFSTVKLKVARRRTPIEDAVVIQKIRETVGYSINIRVDANRRWSYAEAMQFAFAVKEYNLQYVEEPIKAEENIIKFCEESGLPVALDETLDVIKGDFVNHLQKYAHPGIEAIVIKPSRVGGFENTALIAKWAFRHNKMAVVSSAYESSLSLSTYVQFSYFLHIHYENICKTRNKHFHDGFAHGLGTYKWIKEDIVDQGLINNVLKIGGRMKASMKDAQNIIERFSWDSERILSRFCKNEEIRCYSVKIDEGGLSSCFKVKEAGLHTNKNIVIFLHGFLGTSEDWGPIMKSLCKDARMIALDLPGHGKSQVHAKQECSISVETISGLLLKLIDEISTEGQRVVLVGYSMGARIALHMALNSDKIKGAVIISGSPGLKQESNRKIRQAIDKSRAKLLISHGLHNFLQTWYSTKLWSSLREHPHFDRVLQSRTQHDDVESLAKVLYDSSVAKQRSLWDDLKDCKKPLVFIAGEKDSKFVNISYQMHNEMERLCEVFIVPDCGHALHFENPLPLINAIRSFLAKLN